MADQKISQMTNASALTGAEVVPLVQNGSNVKTTIAAISALSANNPRVYAIMSANTSVASGTFTKLAFNIVDGTTESGATFVVGASAAQNSNGTFKPGETGTYFLTCFMRCASLASGKSISAKVMRYPNADGSGTGVSQGWIDSFSSGQPVTIANISAMVQITDANQSIGVEVVHNDTGSKNFGGGNTGCYLMAFKMV
jgi:hypothetical protein